MVCDGACLGSAAMHGYGADRASMKTIGFILLASTLALVTIAVLAGPREPRVASRHGEPWGALLTNVRWFSAISGSRAILTTQFVPRSTTIVGATAAAILSPDDEARETNEALQNAAAPALTVHWSLPLVSRFLSPSRRLESMASDLQDAINRIEPMYDRTRLDGLYTDTVVVLRVSSGTASLSDVFGEHWHLASDDPNVNARVSVIGLAWRRTTAEPCEAFTKNRQHDIGEPTLTSLDVWDCRQLQVRQAPHFNDAEPVPLVVAPLSVPVFAAPMPGSRLSSDDFWAAQKARINAIQERLRRKWDAAKPPVPTPDARPELRLSSNG